MTSKGHIEAVFQAGSYQRTHEGSVGLPSFVPSKVVEYAVAVVRLESEKCVHTTLLALTERS